MPVVNPVKKKNKGRLVPLVPNQVAISSRGARRHERTPDYLAAYETRKRQTYGHRKRANVPGPGPLKGPTKRDKGISHQDWVKLMSTRTK
jgi:hypothetical protein